MCLGWEPEAPGIGNLDFVFLHGLLGWKHAVTCVANSIVMQQARCSYHSRARAAALPAPVADPGSTALVGTHRDSACLAVPVCPKHDEIKMLLGITLFHFPDAACQGNVNHAQCRRSPCLALVSLAPEILHQLSWRILCCPQKSNCMCESA